jgi:hypothetical protein
VPKRWAVLAVVLALAPYLIFTAALRAHPADRKAPWEHTADVYRFFHNHRQLEQLAPAQRAIRWHDRYAYRNLIGKWGGVHRCEGSWTDPSAPYYGGLQMDWSFMRSYGGEFLAWWGTADRWPPWAQMAAAERAYRSGRGYSPWPVCGAYGG